MSQTHVAVKRKPGSVVLFCILLGTGALTGCMGTSGEVELQPESREGIFYNVFAEAQQEALRQNKHILLDLWRPG